jgi:hypothetical protein
VNTELDISKILSSFSRHKGIIIAVFVVVSVLSVYLAAILPEVYRSTTLIFVSPQKFPRISSPHYYPDFNERMQSITQEILSRTGLEKSLRIRSLCRTAKGFYDGDRVNALRRRIGVDFRRSNIFQLSFESEKVRKRKTGHQPPVFALHRAKSAGAWKAASARCTKSFINAEAERLRKELEQQERRSQPVQALNRFELPDIMDANLRDGGTAAVRITGRSRPVSRRCKRDGVLENSLWRGDCGSRVVGSQRSKRSNDGCCAAKSSKGTRRSLRRYSPKHPDVMRLKAEIEAAEADARSEQAAEWRPETRWQRHS